MFQALWFLLLVCAVEAMRIQGNLQTETIQPHRTQVLVNGTFATFVTRNNSFQLQLPQGHHLIDVVSASHHFPSAQIIIKNQQITYASLVMKGYAADRFPAIDTLHLSPMATYDFFIPRDSFSFFSILKNPMILMTLLTLGMLYVMPKMMENMDPEELKQLHQSNPANMQVPDMSDMLGNLLGTTTTTQTTQTAKKSKKIK